MSDFYFETKDLSVGYNGNALIHDICVHIRRGEIVSLIGPNGSGKSTILKTITRSLKAIQGSVRIAQSELFELSLRDLSKKMAVVLTERIQPELMTCWDIVASGRYPYTGKLGILSAADKEQVISAMETVHALDLADRDFNAISDGQRQRILLARAICQEPEIIVLDEPTSYLDIRHKLELLTILRKMAREKQITVIMSLHEIDLAQKISDKIICVKGETISCYGSADAVFRQIDIHDLYDMSQGVYDPLFGNTELDRPKGPPRIFVLSAGGTGIPIYRALQRNNLPFSAGILYTNDVDYFLARHLASEVVTEQPFCEISDAAFEKALFCIRESQTVIRADFPIGPANRRMIDLLDAARDRLLSHPTDDQIRDLCRADSAQ